MKGFSVIMPTFNNANYIRRAILSLLDQIYQDWELIIVDDGSTDDTKEVLNELLLSSKVTYLRNSENLGLGRSINIGISRARYDYIAYLPADDYYFNNHLQVLLNEFEKSDDIVLVYSGVKFDMPNSLNPVEYYETKLIINGSYLQLVQSAHKRNTLKWLERDEWVTENYFLMYWNKLISLGTFSFTKRITCFYLEHPNQRHRIISEKFGGSINKYRAYYNIKKPIRIKISKYKFVDEEVLYKSFRRKHTIKKNSLKILIVGELSYNPERIVAFEEAGHKLYGLWLQNPVYSFSFVGPLPFGNIEDVPFSNWRDSVREIKPDIIYAISNWDAVSFANEVRKSLPEIPFVWHFKEGPLLCQKNGVWNDLFELYSYSDGTIFLNEEVKEWYELFIKKQRLSMVMDMDTPKKDYFNDDFSDKLSSSDGAIHTVVPGRIIGVTEDDVRVLAKNNVHIHLYTENYHESREGMVNSLKQAAPDYFHSHPHCSSWDWVKEFSKYDAGWLHCFESINKGVLIKACWDDLNLPARMNTLAAAGLPMIEKDNAGNIVAMQSKIKKMDIGVFYKDMYDLSNKLRDKDRIAELTNNVLKNREKFYFDYYVPELISFFREVINKKNNKNNE
jgi:glycosyltransferase involved in cell wall biosynthesis